MQQNSDHLKKTDLDRSQVLCDVCTDVKQKAIISCLDCGVTFCTSHLEPHYNVPNYMKHKLINAVENVEEYRCQEHERPLDLFCREDERCVCEFCAKREHRSHEVLSLGEENEERKGELEKTQTELQKMIQERLEKIQDISHSVELSKRNTEKEKSDSVEVFSALIHSIERSQAELLEMMEVKQKSVEEQAEELIKELEQEIEELQRRDTELEQLLQTDDHFNLLQIDPSLCVTPLTKNWTEISINTNLSVDDLRLSLSQLQNSLNDKLRETVSTELKRIQQYSAESSSRLTKEQSRCSICSEVFTRSVSRQCGHNVCQGCITQSWDMDQKYNCPLCNKKFNKSPGSKRLLIPEEMADNLNKINIDKSQVLCDVCTGVKQKAIKSCLDCGVTFCTSHLEPHNYVSNYEQHKLINAVKNLEKYVCQKHKKPLEQFCRDDQVCVCQFCTEGKHQNHNIIPIKEESGQRKGQLEKKQSELQKMIQERLKKIQEINHSVELSKRNTEKEKSQSIELFATLIHSIEIGQAELLDIMEEKQKSVEEQAKGLIKDLEQEIKELQRRDTELEQLSQTDDHLHLLQIYSSLCVTPNTKHWTEISINTELCVDDLRTALSQLQKSLNKKLSTTLNEKLNETVSAELKRIQQYAVDVTLDPDTAHPSIVLSYDGKQVSCGNTKKNLPNIPKRFTNYSIILGNQGFSSGRFYFEVQVSRKTKWDLGVVRESVNRKGEIETFKPQNGFWTLSLRNRNEYTARDDPSVTIPLREKPQMVGVFVDYEEGLVSFYDVDARSHIYSFTGQSFTEKLYPYFSPCDTDKAKNSTDKAPLIISLVLKTK